MKIDHLKSPAKNQCIAFRVTEAHKALFERAPIQALLNSQIVLELGPEGSCAFIESLLSPRKADELPELQRAIQHYQHLEA